MAFAPFRNLRPRILLHSIRLNALGLVVAAATGVLPLSAASGEDSEERSVLISSRKSFDNDPLPSQVDASANPAGEELAEPLAPIAVATDQQPKLASTPASASQQSTSDNASGGTSKDEVGVGAAGIGAGGLPKTSQDAATARGESSDGPDEESESIRIETARFHGIQPGTTKIDEVKDTWGAPQHQSVEGRETRFIYQVPPFKSVELGVEGDVVRSIQLELKDYVGQTQLARQLRLDRFRPAPIRNQQGIELGLAYPERGVVFSFVPKTVRPVISHVLLEPVSSQPFVLRAEGDLHGPYRSNRRDLQVATQLNPEYARAWWQVAAIELATGRISSAEQAAGRAVRLDPADVAYRLRWAACLAELEKYHDAIAQTRQIAESSETPAPIRAEALVQLAQLQSVQPDAEPPVIQLYQKAIEIAGELSTDSEVAPRRLAKRVLVDAHLGMAREIAQGQWREKEKVVPLWLERASAFAEDMIQNEGAGREIRLHVAAQALQTLAVFPPSAGPAEWVREAKQTFEDLHAEHDDEQWQARLHWEVGQAYLHALRVEHARGRPADALRYGQSALSHLREGARLREASPFGEHVVARLYFHLGAIHAIHHDDHEKAIVWYDKATPMLTRPTPRIPGVDPRLHGDALVSMGVSYWEIGDRERALELTKWGTEVLESAVDAGALEDSTLTVAYGNLANMHKSLGHQPEANRYIEIAERLDAIRRQ